MNQSLTGKKILIGISGSIAAYKSAILVRELVKSGAEVKVVMTESAKNFVSPLTFSTLSKNQVYTQFSDEQTSDWHNHVELGLWPDLMLVAPASANTIARFANGLCDNLLTAIYLSARCPVWVAPAMDLDMYNHVSTQHNLSKLKLAGNTIIEPEEGELASGLFGKGRMAEPFTIVEKIFDYFTKGQKLAGKKVLVTAGPTIEPIDPVRFISNHSTGKMGYAIAEVFAEAGADVTLISGPVHIPLSNRQIQLIRINTANEMMEAALKHHQESSIVLFTAAVADYRPAVVAEQKIKKDHNETNLHLDLVQNKDIAAELGKHKKPGQLHIGFALETTRGIEYATRKLQEKNLDFIVLNMAGEEGAAFGSETNRVTFIDKYGNKEPLPLKTKHEVALDILEKVTNLSI